MKLESGVLLAWVLNVADSFKKKMSLARWLEINFTPPL